MTEDELWRQNRIYEALEDLKHVITVDDDSLTRRFLEKYHTTIELALENAKI